MCPEHRPESYVVGIKLDRRPRRLGYIFDEMRVGHEIKIGVHAIIFRWV